MSNKIVNSKNIKKEFAEIENIQEPPSIKGINEKNLEISNEDILKDKTETVQFLNNVSNMLEGDSSTSSDSKKTIHERESTVCTTATLLDEFFEGRKNNTFEWYQRAGKFFFRCEHNFDKNYSEMIQNAFESIIEKKMNKTGIHYIITSNSTSAVFR